jgi:hypothetical protein
MWKRACNSSGKIFDLRKLDQWFETKIKAVAKWIAYIQKINLIKNNWKSIIW